MRSHHPGGILLPAIGHTSPCSHHTSQSEFNDCAPRSPYRVGGDRVIPRGSLGPSDFQPFYHVVSAHLPTSELPEDALLEAAGPSTRALVTVGGNAVSAIGQGF